MKRAVTRSETGWKGGFSARLLEHEHVGWAGPCQETYIYSPTAMLCQSALLSFIPTLYPVSRRGNLCFTLVTPRRSYPCTKSGNWKLHGILRIPNFFDTYNISICSFVSVRMILEELEDILRQRAVRTLRGLKLRQCYRDEFNKNVYWLQFLSLYTEFRFFQNTNLCLISSRSCIAGYKS